MTGAHFDLDLVRGQRRRGRGAADHRRAEGRPCLQMRLAIGATLDMPAAEHSFGAQVFSLSFDIGERGYEEGSAYLCAV